MTKKKVIVAACALTFLLSGCLLLYFYLWRTITIIPENYTGSFSSTYRLVDGCFVYSLSASVITPDGNPLQETKVIAFSDAKTKPSDIDASRDIFSTTDSQGRIELTAFSGLSWGGGYRPGIDSPPQPPVPDNPKVLYLWHKDSEGQWHQTEIGIKDSDIIKSQQGGLHIHIEKIQVNEKENLQ